MGAAIKLHLKKQNKTRRPTKSFCASRGGQAGFIFIHFHLPRLRQKLSFFAQAGCVSVTCDGPDSAGVMFTV